MRANERGGRPPGAGGAQTGGDPDDEDDRRWWAGHAIPSSRTAGAGTEAGRRPARRRGGCGSPHSDRPAPIATLEGNGAAVLLHTRRPRLVRAFFRSTHAGTGAGLAGHRDRRPRPDLGADGQRQDARGLPVGAGPLAARAGRPYPPGLRYSSQRVAPVRRGTGRPRSSPEEVSLAFRRDSEVDHDQKGPVSGSGSKASRASDQ